MVALIRTLSLSVVDLFHPRILLLVFVPPIMALFFWIFITWYFWQPIHALGMQLLESSQWLISMSSWLQDNLHLEMVTLVMVLFALLVLLPLILISTLVLVNILAMPVILRHQEKNYFPGLVRNGTNQIRRSLGNAARVFGIFTVGWVLSIPFWSVPFLGPMLSFALLVYLNSKVFMFDALAEHASQDEMQTILKQSKWDFFFLGGVLTLILTIPVINLLTPVYGGLVFSRYGLGRLQQLRN